MISEFYFSLQDKCRAAERACAGESSVSKCMRNELKKSRLCPEKYSLLVVRSGRDMDLDMKYETNYEYGSITVPLPFRVDPSNPRARDHYYECIAACHSYPEGYAD